MKRIAVILVLVLAWAAGALADDLTLVTGQVVTGKFVGFRNYRFVFQERGGKPHEEYAADVKSLRVDQPAKVAVQLVAGKLDDVLFAGYDKFNVRLLRNGREFEQPAPLIKQVDLAFDVQRTVESPGVYVISHGEDVDIEKSLMAGRINVVFFHYPEAHSSVRQGNYIELQASRSGGRVAVQKLVIANWQAPICKAKQLTSLPQFWFYSPSGHLVKKLTERFTESDIDDAFKETRRSL